MISTGWRDSGDHHCRYDQQAHTVDTPSPQGVARKLSAALAEAADDLDRLEGQR